MSKKEENSRLWDSSSKIEEDNYRLILFNDDENLFEYVVDCLVEVCKFDYQRAEQCTILAHFNGKYPIMRGNKEFLENIQKELYLKNLNTKIEK